MGERMKISILGTEYELLERSVKDDKKLTDADGYCDTSTKVCVVDDMSDPEYDSKGNLEEYKNQLKRHEIIHAFLFESGLDVNTWAGNEEIVDWIAIQFPKLLRAFEKAGCI